VPRLTWQHRAENVEGRGRAGGAIVPPGAVNARSIGVGCRVLLQVRSQDSWGFVWERGLVVD
jgi:hypothetical protein